MLDRASSFARRGVLLLAAGLLLAPGALVGQDADFLFKRPRLTVGFNVGWAAPRAGSDYFAFTDTTFTVDLADFASFAVSGELAYRVTERVDIGVEVGYSRKEVPSEYVCCVDLDDRPIRQVTKLQRRPFTFNAKYYLKERGRSVSRFAWVPSEWSPWVGAGVGWMWYRFEQVGDFIFFDDEDWPVFSDQFDSEGSAPMLQLSGGADVSLGPRFVFSGQLGYSWASAELDTADFEGWDELDLAGFRATAGVKVRL